MELITIMKNIITKLSIMLLLLVTHTSIAETINKSPNDPRSYDSFTLENGLEVVTVSDANIAQSAATLSVGVGQFQDPESHQGLAHFLEHMIFMGSDESPQPGELMEFVSKNGGTTNAFTAQTQTTYLFSVDSAQFEPALARLSAAIKSPLFDKTMVDKEINAVNSEWLTQYQSDQFVLQRVFARTGNETHPRVQLGVGNLETLNKDKSALLPALKEFHQQYYSANIMKLVLVGKESHKALKAIAQKHFSTIKNNNINRPVVLQAPYKKEHLKKHIYVKSKVKHPALAIEFAIENNIGDWQNKTNVYLAHLLSSEEDGALISTLRDQGLIQTASVAILPNVWGNSGSAFIDFSLTDKGQANKESIFSQTFAYIELLKTQGINQAYADELKGLLTLQFEDFITPQPLQLAIHLSQVIYNYPTQHLIDHSYLFTDFQPEKITQALTKFTPEHVRIYHISPTENSDTPLTYAEGGYSTANITPQEIQQWKSVNTALKLPQAEVIEQNKNVVVDLNGDFSTPQNIHKAPGLQVYFSESTHHKGKEGVLNIAFAAAASTKNVDSTVGAAVLNFIFAQQNSRFFQRAQQRKRVTVIPNLNASADPLFILIGRSNKQLTLAEDLISKYTELTFDQDDLDKAYKFIKDAADSFDEQKLNQQLSYYSLEISKRFPALYSRKLELEALNRITVDSLKQLHQNIVANSFIDIYAHGNFAPKELITFAKETRTRLGKGEMKRTYLKSDFKPKADTAKMKKVAVIKNGVGIRDTYVYPEKSYKILAQFQVLNRLMSTAFFNDLRTRKQLGYQVSSFVENIHEYPAMSMQVVSDNTNLQQLKEKAMQFHTSFYHALNKIDESAVVQLTTAMTQEMERKPDNIFVEVGKFLVDWEWNKHDFTSHKNNIEYTKNTSKADLLKLYKNMFIDGNHMNVVVQLKGEDFKETNYFSWENFGKNE